MKLIKINAGCGKTYIDGYTNIDVALTPGRRSPDILCDMRKVPLGDGCASEILAVHIFEHFYPWEAIEVLREWRRLLIPGGALIAEMPDVIKCCRNLVDGVTREGRHPDQLGYWGLYGDPRHENPYMMHRWGWTFATIAPLLADNGFVEMAEKETVFHSNGRRVRDFRVEARKA